MYTDRVYNQDWWLDVVYMKEYADKNCAFYGLWDRHVKSFGFYVIDHSYYADILYVSSEPQLESLPCWL